MRRLRRAHMASIVVGMAAGVGAFVAPSGKNFILETRFQASSASARITCHRRRQRRRHSSMSQVRSSWSGKQQEEGNDDQRVFWDTTVEVLRSELGDEGTDLSRVWDFVAHNRDGNPPPTSDASYRATGLYFPGLEAKPWWDSSEFAWLQEFEDAAADIAREMKALARAGGGRSYKGGTGEMSTVYDATQGWGTMRIRYMGRFRQPGVNYALLPRTLSTLRRLPLAPETAAFQRQLPGTGLPLHVDPSNFVLGCHLGIDIPPAVAVDTSSQCGLDGAQGGNATGKRDVSSGKSSGTGFGGGGSGGPTTVVSGRRSTKTGAGGRRKGGGDIATMTTTTTVSSAIPRLVEGGEVEQPKRVGGVAAVAGGEKRLGGSDASTVVDVSGSLEGGDHGTVGDGGVGKRAWIEVAGKKRNWETGRAFVFDPSFLHRTHNPTLGERVILNVDIWHPGLEDVEKKAICTVCELVEQWNTRSGLFAE